MAPARMGSRLRAALIAVATALGVLLVGTPASADVIGGAFATPSTPVPPYSNPLGVASSAWGGMCPPTVGSSAPNTVPPSSWAGLLAGSFLGVHGDWLATAQSNINTAVHVGWDTYVANNKGQAPPGGFTSADLASAAAQARLQEVLTSDTFWAGFMQRVWDVGAPPGVDSNAFLGWIGDESTGVSGACDDRFNLGTRLWASDTDWFWQSGSSWAKVTFPDGVTTPLPRYAGVIPIRQQLGAYLVTTRTTSYLPTVKVAGILRLQPTGAPTITTKNCAPNLPSASVTTQQLLQAVESTVAFGASWIPGVPVPTFDLECDTVAATYTPITGPTVDGNSIQISDDGHYLLGWTYLPQADGSSPPSIVRWAFDGSGYTAPVKIASALDIDTGFDGVPRLALSGDGSTAALCNAGPGGLTAGLEGVAHYPFVVHIDAGTAGWPQTNTTDFTRCGSLTLDATGSHLWWSQGGTTPGWFTSATLVGAGAPPQVRVTGVADGASYEYGTVPPAGCAVTDVLNPSATATSQLSAPTGPDAAHGIGAIRASCAYTDQLGRATSASVTFHVVDTAPPVFGPAQDATVEATGPDGATVAYTAPSAVDAVDGVTAVTCTPLPGAVFPLGATSVRCTSADASGNTAATGLTVTVQDTTPPVVVVPGTLSVDATAPSGATVTYAASAMDLVDGPVTPVCTTASGATFPIGDTSVSCKATDAHGNTSAPQSFTVHVRSAAEQLTSLDSRVASLPGLPSSYLSQVQAAQESVAAGTPTIAVSQLQAFVHHVDAQTGKQLPAPQAAALRAVAQRVEAVLGG